MLRSVYLSGGPQYLAYDSGRGEIFVTNQVRNTTAVLNDTTDQIVATIPVGTAPEGVAYDPTDGKIFVVNSGTNNVSVISDATNKVVATVPVGLKPEGVAWDSVTDRVYVTNGESDNVSIFSGATDAYYNSVGVGNFPDAIVYDPVVSHFFIGNAASDNVTVVGGISTLGSAPVGNTPSAITFDQPQRAIVVVNGGSNNLTIVNDTTYLVNSNTPPVFNGPDGVAVDSGTAQGFITNFNTDNASVVSTAGGGPPVANVPLGKAPIGIVYDPGVGNLFVANYESGNVSVIYDGTHPTVASFSANPGTLNAGSWTNLTLTGETGTLPDQFAYTGLPPGCSTSDSDPLDCRPMVPGTYEVRAYRNDSAGHSVNATTTLVVDPKPVGPTITSFTATPSDVVNGSQTDLAVSVDGGVGALTYMYVGLPPGCGSESATTLACTPYRTGSFTVRVYVNDSTGNSTSATTPLTVSAPPPPAITSFTVTPSSVPLGGEVNFSVSASGGGPSRAIAYAGLPEGCASANLTLLECQPGSAGTFSVRVYANDSLGRSATTTTSLTVTSSAPVLSSVAISAVVSTIEIDGSTLLTATPSCAGGSCPSEPTYSWTLTNTLGSFEATIGAEATFTAGSSPGVDHAFVNASLSGHTVQSSPLAITISGTAVPTISYATVSPANPTVAPGASVTLTAGFGCSGGTCPSGASYSWSLTGSLGTLSATTGASVTFTAGTQPGLAKVSVNVTLNGAVAEGSTNLTVGSSSPGPGSSKGSNQLFGLPPDEAYLLIGVLAGGVLLVALYAMIRRRRPASLSGSEGATSPTPSSPPPGTPPAVAPAAGTITPALTVPPPPDDEATALASPRVPSPLASAAPVPPAAPVSSSPAAASPPRGPVGWPLTPLATVAAPDPRKVYALASASGFDRDRLLIISPESAGVLSGTYGLAGAECWRLSRIEGDQNVSPADADRLADLLTRHLERGSNRAVVVVGLEKVVDACGLRVALRFLEAARETAEVNKGTVLVALHTGVLKEDAVRQLQEGSMVLSIP